LLSEFPLTGEPRKVIVPLDEQPAVRAILVRGTHPYAKPALAQTGE
jgi:hypothetical protein